MMKLVHTESGKIAIINTVDMHQKQANVMVFRDQDCLDNPPTDHVNKNLSCIAFNLYLRSMDFSQVSNGNLTIRENVNKIAYDALLLYKEVDENDVVTIDFTEGWVYNAG